MRLASILVPELEQEFATTRRHLVSAGDDMWDWRPHERSRSLGELLWHLTEISGWYGFVLGRDDFDFAPVAGEPYQAPSFESQTAMLSRYDRDVKACLRRLRLMNDEALLAQWTLLYGGETVFSGPRFAAFRTMVISHMIRHRAQLTTYLRQTAGFVPKTYGPSADERVMA